MEIIIGVAAKIAEYTVGPILNPIARPFKTLWEYKSNLEKLKNEVTKLEAKSGDVQRLTNVGVEPPPAVKDWQGKVTEISNEVSGLNSQHNPQQQSTTCCQRFICSNLKKCYQQRSNVARILENVAQLYQEATESENLWEYKSNLENLKKEMENLKAARERVQHLIKDGEEALPQVKDWQGTVNNIINEILELINPQQQNMQCCKRLICPDCYQRREKVAMKLKDVAELLKKASGFGEVSTITEETVYKNNLEDLKTEAETLKIKKESVQRLIKVGEEPLPDVKAWQDKVKKIIDEVSGLTSEHNPEQQNNVARILKEVAQLLQEQEKFKEVSYKPKPELTCLQPSIQQEASESRMSILKDIIAALRNTDVNLVGIYGMGGVGKTTLANKVRYQAVQDKLFDKVLFVEVSQSPEIRTIQGVIADCLGLKFEEETVQGRAGKLWDVLKKEEKILIILDNLWMGIKLEKIGIPFGNDCKGLKLLLTARSHDVLTKEMDSQHNFYVEALSAAEAWSLFKNIAGTCIDSPHFKYIAEEVVKKCGRMPVAIVAVAKALKGTQSQDEWKDALRRLNNPSSESFEGITKEVFTSIKWSYDCLPKDLREIFLLCSRMGCTYDASVQDLFRYGLGLGLFDKFDTIEEALCHVYASVNKLKAASLLLDAPEAFFDDTPACERFAIHDVIYDVARSIASEGRHIFTVLDDHVPRSLTNGNTLEKCTSITLYNIGELPKDLALNCPNLKFLCVKAKNSYLTIPHNFFGGMSNLQVLHLIQIDLSPLPTTFSCLLNLQALFLDNCKLKNVVVIGDMKKLEILSFRGSDIKKLPKNMRKLTKLRLLDLSNCRRLRVIPSKVLSSLTRIEALYMHNSSIQWEVARPNIEGSNVGIDELKHLRCLTILEMQILDAKMFRGLISSEIKRYKISIGVDKDWKNDRKSHSKTSRMLELCLDTKADWIISQLPGVEALKLEGEVVGAINLLDDLDRNGFPQLIHLDVSKNNHAVSIVNPASCTVLPSLELLMVQFMGSLKKICNSPLGAESFLNLKTIHVGNCKKLSNIFCFSSIVRVFPNLIDLKVDTCENMEEIFAIEEQDDGSSTKVLVHDIQFSQISYLRLMNLPKLRSFCCKAKTASPLQLARDTLASEIFSREELDNPSSLFNKKVVVTNLKTLEICYIHVESIWDNQLPTMSNLACLIISNLANLRRLASGDYIKFPLLKEMTVQNCPKLQELFFDDKVGVPSLERIKILKMDNLKMIWQNQPAEDSFPKLKSLEVQECQKLLTLFQSNMCGSFLSLETLNVNECGCLEEIFDLRGINSEESHSISSTQSGELCTYSPLVLSFANLQNLQVSKCQNLKTLFSTSLVAKEEVDAQEASCTARFVFLKLTSLRLDALPELRTFYPGRYITEWPILKSLKMYQCGTLHTSELLSLHSQVGFVFQVGKIWPNLLSTMSSWVQNLTKLIVHGCGNLEEMFPHSTIVTEELREKKIVFPYLNYLEMEQLANLKRLCSGRHIEFPTLKEFKISSCPELTTFIFDDKVKVPNLKKVKISSMDNLKMIWDNQVTQNSIPKLKSLEVQGCRTILTLLPWNMFETFWSIETLDVSDCGSLEEIFDLHVINFEERHPTTSTQSKELNTTYLSFENLQVLEVWECASLKSLFSVLNVAKEEEATKEAFATVKFVFPKLTSLKLQRLRSFYPGRHTVEGPVLRRLQLWDCGIPDTDDEDQMQQPLLLLNKLAFPRLGELFLAGKDLTTMWPGQDAECLLRDFKMLYVHDESRTCWSLAQVRGLQYIGNVKYMWKKNFKLDLILPNFEEITVLGCDSFISLMPPYAFQNLTGLYVCRCHRLENIGTFSMVKNLVKLVRLNISRCEKIAEIVGNYGDVTGDKIIFSNLESLSLQYLPSLTSFCCRNFTLEFPSLEELYVSMCPNMKFFSKGDLTTPKLQEVENYCSSVELCPDIDVSTAIQQLHEEERRGRHSDD